jgi:polysaccharide biosynthesis/export protein
MQIARSLTIRVLTAALVLASVVARSQTAEQLELFRNLTPEQQQALLEQLGSGSAAPAADAAGSSAARRTEAAADGERRDAGRAQKKEQEESKPPVLRSADSVLVQADIGDTSLEGNLRVKAQELAELIRSRNPYQLDHDAQLNLPGLGPIALGGLTEQQGTRRLGAEPALRVLKLTLTRLPLVPSGVQGLKPFGYALFDDASSTFASVMDGPVPADYIVGTGDEFNIQLFGNQNRTHRLTVNREGVISFPELGPIRVGGLAFSAASRAIEARVSRQLIGVQVNVAMGDTRTIRVFVAGDARRPGSYTVNGLATMTTALFASGGVNPIGSLRNIQLMRQGAVVRNLDLYDLLIRGDTSDDAKLLAGDTIFIPPIGNTISVDGEIKRPAIYELRDEASIADVVRLAGGYTPEADAGRASLLRIEAGSQRIVVDVNLTQSAGSGLAPRNGDVLRVARLRPQLDVGVVLEGFVYRPGSFAWREGLRLTDVIGSVDELRPGADQHYVLIRRESGQDRRVSMLSADLTAALAAPTSAANPVLAQRDRVIVFDFASGRERILQPLIEELKLQAGLDRPTELVRVEGRVKVAGEYPLEPGMRVTDLLRAGGGLDSAAYGGSAELTRYTIGDAGVRQTHLIPVDLAAVRRGDADANLLLHPFDYLIVKEAPDWTNQESVTVRGQVRFPGIYPIRAGETLSQVLERAGGLTSLAFPGGAAFTRRDLRQLEQQQLDRLAERLRADLASLALQAANAGQSSAGETLQAGQSLLAELQGAKATGRFVIDLPGLLAATSGSDTDVTLRDGDDLVIPKLRQEVTVIGEVQNTASHLFQSKLERDNYIAKSGGTTKKADRKRIYVVRADGSTASGSNRGASIKPGDTIVVPVDTERMPRLPFWQAVTQILYNVAVSVAAVNSF